MKLKTLRTAAFTICLTLFVSIPFQAIAQGTRPNGSLILEANAKQSDPDGSIELVFLFPEATTGSAVVANLIVYNPTEVQLTSLVGTILNPHFKFTGQAYPGENGTCTKTLAAKATCKIEMVFKPQSAGFKRGLVRLNYWEAGSPKTSFRVILGDASNTH